MVSPSIRQRVGSLLFPLALCIALIAIALLGYRLQRLERLLAPEREGAPAAPPVVARGELSPLEKTTTELFRRASRSVVHITTLDVQTDLFRLRVLEIPRGTGSGFLWDDQGHVVTNLHVLSSAQRARVTLADHSEWSAELVGTSPRHDLAVLRIAGAASRATPLPLGTSSDLVVGQYVAAIGSPFGLDYTLSTGVISGLGREIPGQLELPIRGAIQTDAAINPGNSGGPLMDSSGRLIGVNTAIYSPSGASAGVGFAIPVDTVARVVPELIRYGREVRPVLGVELADDALTRRLGLRGVLVGAVLRDSPAAQAGLLGVRRNPESGKLLLGDVIVSLNDTPITSQRDLHRALDTLQPGDEVSLQLLRDGEQLRARLRLGANVGQ
ncbi:MAG: trypsin-like peptidase domain-containing protein [Myxococcales bacterium]|nr:trypsin-like peptidase domain-containing protein [Myxococcales bacterium]